VGNLGPWEILIIAGVIVLLFGATKMPTMARSLGQSMRILKAEAKGAKQDDGVEQVEAAQPAAPAQVESSEAELLKAKLEAAEARAQLAEQKLSTAQKPEQIAPQVEEAQANKNAN
jgi:sec-independent protein translocase protein TatA